MNDSKRMTMSGLKPIITILVFGLFVGQAFAQNDTVFKFTLVQAQDFAVDHYYAGENAKIDVDMAKKKIWETTAIGLPQVSGKIQGGYTPTLPGSIEQFSSLSSLGIWMYGADQALYNITHDPNFGNIPEPGAPEEININDMKWNLNATLTVTQLLFSGSYLVGLQSAKVYQNISELNKIKTDQDIRELVANSYYNVLIAGENKVILDSTYNNMVKVLEQMKAMANQGYVEETDIDQMELTTSNIKNSLDMVIRLTDIAEKLLKTQLGLALDAHVELSQNLDDLVSNLSYDKMLLQNLNLENNINYALLDNQVKASELLLKLDKSAFLPDLAAFYQYQKEFNDKAFTFTPPHTLGVSMSIPILSSGARMAKVSQSKLALIKAENMRDQMGNSLNLDFQNSKSALITADEKYQTEKKNLELSKKIFDRALVKFSNGMITSIDLTQVQNQYFSTQANYYTALQELIAAKNKLEKILKPTE